MGGYGSGRHWGRGFRITTDNYRAIDVRRWRRNGLLEPGTAFGWNWSREGEQVASIRVRIEHGRLRLIYRQCSYGDDWQDMDYPVALTWTTCNLGGSRPWFRCPARGCGRRVAILYGGEVFACRQCHQLAYPSQNEDGPSRAMRRAESIRRKLGWAGGVLDGGGWEKPKGMHWRTYYRLCEEHDYWEAVSMGFLAQRLGMAMPEGWDELLAC